MTAEVSADREARLREIARVTCDGIMGTARSKHASVCGVCGLILAALRRVDEEARTGCPNCGPGKHMYGPDECTGCGWISPAFLRGLDQGRSEGERAGREEQYQKLVNRASCDIAGDFDAVLSQIEYNARAEGERAAVAHMAEKRYHELETHYGRDHGEKLTLGDLVAKLTPLADDTEKFCDELDRLFLVGAWGFEPTPYYFLRDIRGLCLGLLRAGREAEREAIAQFVEQHLEHIDLTEVHQHGEPPYICCIAAAIRARKEGVDRG